MTQSSQRKCQSKDELGSCGCSSNPDFTGMERGYKKVLAFIIAINAIMFVVETSAGYLSGSQALKADALDFLGDSLTYGLSLVVIGMSLSIRALAAIIKGISLALMSMYVLASTLYQFLILETPHAEVISSIGLLALIANLISVMLLVKYKDGDANIRSVWLCSRNDAIGNIAVIIAGGVVWLTQSAWPDLIVALLVATLFLKTSRSILQQAWSEYKTSQKDARECVK